MKTLARAAMIGALFATTAMAAHAQTPPPVPAAEAMFQATTLNLSAYGEVRTAPDMATISLGVMTEAKTAVEAMRQNATRMTEVVASLRRSGVAEKDIQTSNLNLSAQYHYEENKPPQLTGYQASNTVTIRVLDLNKIGAALDAVVSVGANQINGISFGLKDPQAAENAARQKAVQALTAKASLYAGATGHRVGRLVTLSEGGGYSVPPPMPMAMMARGGFAKDEASTPVSGGEIVVRIDINGLYELNR